MGGPADGLLAQALRAPGDARAARRILPLLELTALDADGEGPIEALSARALDAGIAALRLRPHAARVARRRLAGTRLRLATVANFADAGDDVVGIAAEVADGVAAGAHEVEVMAPSQAILDGDLGLVGELVEACRGAAAGRALALVLDVTALGEAAPIAAAARAAIMAGVERLVSTSRDWAAPPPLDATAVLLAVVEEAEGRVGIGIGGTETTKAVAGHLHLVDAIMGSDWITPSTVRVVGSSLLDDVLEIGASGNP